MSKSLVIIEYADLLSGEKDLSGELLQAWGADSLGVIAIRGIPDWEQLYPPVLKLSHSLAHLPAESLANIEHEASMYNVGWSHGKEKLGDKPDFAKGSFYFNPLTDTPGSPEERQKYPMALMENLWPSQELPELKERCMALGQKMHHVSILLARLVDRTMPGQAQGYEAHLGKAIGESEKCKSRLLYYFPPKDAAAAPAAKEDAVPEDGWIGWHNDCGFFTGLTPDMYIDEETGEVVDNPDPESAGLWIVDRDGGSLRVGIPKDCMAVQVGEGLQVVTGGTLVATPHCVRGCRPSTTGGRRIARVSCPCFTDTHPAFALTAPSSVDRDHVVSACMSSKVPPLAERWTENGMPFNDFLNTTFQKFYEWTLKA
eukprot:TRINITY_DN23063_c0_g1_i1.p1 TRINITY_DN23063_c0_g1~~TRINITY_DN23063_c0_g1_i1.p1  ORF type:complete len:371 (+),score=94.36 TRINITY_DN23063_c0_g1_i1:94-1206(+)